MDQIISHEVIRAKAKRAYAAGKGRDEHGFNWHAAAVSVWQEEWDRQHAVWSVARRQREQVAA